MAAAAGQTVLSFFDMTEAQLRQWVEANPGWVNDRDEVGRTHLVAAAMEKEGLPLVVWLLDKQGADMNATTGTGKSALHSLASSTFSLPCWTVARTQLWQTATASPLLCGTRPMGRSMEWHACCESRASEPLSMCKM
jgi:hypothetical protein